jgi:branched-chain amino acid transport system ATP-binding protein
MSTPLLTVDNIHTYYGKIHALKGISITIQQGEIVTLIGANGAGKSTILRTISGQLKAKEGSVIWRGQPIQNIPAYQIAQMGIGHVPEGRHIFPRLTVRENLEIGAFTIRDKGQIAQRMEHGFTLFPRLRERVNQLGGTLSGGEQQMLAIARGLMTQPQLLLLDEPSMGLAPVLVDAIFEIVETLHKNGTTILLVEQNARMALSIADRGYILQTGKIVLEDNAASLKESDEVRKSYLGEG